MNRLMTERHDERCPNCGKFVALDAEGYYDREWPYEDKSIVVCYCDEQCCIEKRQKDTQARIES